jgi:ribulose-5-phosphate 4-epimerase/fuculose-1-phosphate aldolase
MHNFQKKYENEINEIIESCHRLAELGYVTSSGGNISLRVEDKLLLITPTKTPKRTIHFEDICAVDLVGNTVFAPEGKKSTGETPIHVRIMRKRPDVAAIVHAHPPILTGFAIAGSDLLAKPFLPEPITEVGPMLVVPYETPLTDALSLQFDAVIEKSNGFLMENHGALLCSVNSVFEAVELMQMMECMGSSVLTAIALGNAKPITAKYVKEMDQVSVTRSLNMPGARGRFHSASELYNIKEDEK